MSFLATAGSTEFGELKRVLKVSDGNLSTHLRKLELAEYVAIEKSFKGRKPLTTVSLTASGTAAFKEYVEGLSAMLEPKK